MPAHAYVADLITGRGDLEGIEFALSKQEATFRAFTAVLGLKQRANRCWALGATHDEQYGRHFRAL